MAAAGAAATLALSSWCLQRHALPRLYVKNQLQTRGADHKEPGKTLPGGLRRRAEAVSGSHHLVVCGDR